MKGEGADSDCYHIVSETADKTTFNARQMGTLPASVAFRRHERERGGGRRTCKPRKRDVKQQNFLGLRCRGRELEMTSRVFFTDVGNIRSRAWMLGGSELSVSREHDDLNGAAKKRVDEP